MYVPASGNLTPQEIYRTASAPRSLPEEFGRSLMAYVLYLERGHAVYDFDTDNRHSPAWGTALRAAIGQALEWAEGNNHPEAYYGNTLLRRIAQELCRDTVLREERLL